ncbi:MAG: DUF924 family protein [Gammaproteobacteria bacterium]
MNKHIEQVLEFWFGGFPDAYSSDPAKADMWFKNGSAYDREIFTRFGGLYDRAINGQLESWTESPRGRLALIILLDQFSRHIHRGQAEAFAQDETAQTICLDGIAVGDDKLLHPVERVFFYLPLEHAENIERQDYSVAAFEGLVEDVPAPHRQMFESNLEYAKRHHHVIELFGRFPELNEILGRQTTDEERAFLEKGEYSFL